MSEKKAFLQVKDLNVEYVTKEETVSAVNGVSFQLEKGKVLGLVGETGAGKTTIARSILRVLQEPPAVLKNGEILMDGKDLLKLSEEEMCRVRGEKITMIFQDPMTSLNPVMSVGKQIAEVIALHDNISKSDIRKKAEDMLETVGIPAEWYDEYPHQFSGGMKQRVVIAIALACSPQLLLADEPTTALDVTIQAQVLELMQKLNKENNTTTILITHDLGVVAQMCDEVAIVYAGEIVESGTLEDIFEHPAHPYTIGLFGALPKLNENVEWLSPIDGMPPDPTNLPEGCKFSPRCPHAAEQCRCSQIGLKEITPGHNFRCLLGQGGNEDVQIN
ncbi:ABC transporter ATP-binding protein [Faecalicatena contorta]|uniref:ABC transporter ATP-binding protein n=1 Tax=Faecalicatena contorta TaxID=39482 RepID=UPI001896EE76|nr:ABC transporter ATP-binding protein [Faecalicatena contorta]